VFAWPQSVLCTPASIKQLYVMQMQRLTARIGSNQMINKAARYSHSVSNEMADDAACACLPYSELSESINKLRRHCTGWLCGHADLLRH
jgi:hypothetical protein